MEVNLKDELQFGVGAHGVLPVNVAGKDSALPLISAPGRVSSVGINTQAGLNNLVSLGGFLTGLAGPISGGFKALTGLEMPSIGLVIQALQSNSDVNVLSTPHLLAADNEESEISVGQNVPFQSGYAPSGLTNLLGSSGASSTSTTSALNAYSSLSNLIAPIQRQNVELKLKIKPQINEGDNVKLTIEEQTEEIASTDPALAPSAVITAYTARWNIETTMQECRSCLGLETTRGWCRRTVLRAAPCLFGLYSVVAVLFDRLPPGGRSGAVSWPGKEGVAFSDALAAVRRWVWTEGVFPQAGAAVALEQLPPHARELLLNALTPAA